MTIDSMDLKSLIEKAPDADFLREMIEVISTDDHALRVTCASEGPWPNPGMDPSAPDRWM